MSHLSQIKTKLNNIKIVQKTLNDLELHHLIKEKDSLNIIVNYTPNCQFELTWNGKEYFLNADLEMWDNNHTIDFILDQITQQYSYNQIIEESIKYGFIEHSKCVMKDGTIKLVIQRWD